ncbi:MAG: DNA gyrase subunit A [Erysipelothrix sp.]|nr:DNA gyrase subunit A [Erysipelothrix sp.]
MNQKNEPINHGRIKKRDISKEMKKSFLDYSMSVIVSRALPDVRDGLKPVHRRILYTMNDLGMYSDRPYKKSARIVGDVMGKYHPHGDSAIYESMVRMSQDFSFRYELVDGHGNFGSIDGDGAAAMRYTEARMSKISMEMLRDLNKNTVNFRDNYDGEETEPSVLPSRFPNLIVNGTTGIAVGMATNIPPHNLGETIDATIAIMENPEITILELMENYIYGPDFPTGGYILGRSGIKKAFETGRGSVVMRAKIHSEELSPNRTRLVVTEIPYQVNKSRLVERIAQLVRDKAIEGISDLRDESNRNGIRVVIELRRDVQEEVILNQLYRMTALQSTFGVNMLALVNNEPRVLNIKQALEYYIKHQIEVVERMTKFDLERAQARAHILEGLIIALDNIDEIISIIRSSDDDAQAQERMIKRFSLSETQTKAILEMQLRRLTGLSRDRIELEHKDLLIEIADLKDILENKERVETIIKDDLREIKEKFGDARRSEISEAEIDMEDEDLIPVQSIFVTLTSNGYIKRVSDDTYRLQHRGGRGIKGMGMHDDDAVDSIIKMSTHDDLMIFTNKGKVYRIKGYRVPASSRTSKGIPIVNLIDLDDSEKVNTILAAREEEMKYLVFVTKSGLVKRVEMSEFNSIRQTGKIAISLKDDDELVAVRHTTGENQIIIGGSNGKAVRFDENDARPMGRNAFGVIGFNTDGSEVVGMATDTTGKYILSITENGYGKKTPLEDYRLTKRGGKGVRSIQLTERNGSLVALRAVDGNEEMMIISDDGIIIRISVADVGTYSRNTQGVKLINLNDGGKVSAVAIIREDEEDFENVQNSKEADNIQIDQNS